MSLSFLAEPAPRNRLLMWAIIGSIFLHAVVLAIRFAPIDLSKFERDASPLEVGHDREQLRVALGVDRRSSVENREQLPLVDQIAVAAQRRAGP